MSVGHVSLVGAGPGDPELLTLKAVRALESADLVLFDALLDGAHGMEGVLVHAKHARRFYVGKRAGRQAIAQETINGLLVRGARRGQRVVRLKCGDPFVFGRGGEEALALKAAGIPFDVVPGVSSAFAAPGLSLIPPTHRGLSSAVVIVSGHAESAYAPVLSPLAPQSATLIVMMGLRQRASIARLLLSRGWPEQTEAAIAHAASHQAAHTEITTLGALSRTDASMNGDAPGTLVIGRVVSLATLLATHVPLAKESLMNEASV
jgi:uroporphyrin-III C-methyltransferase / precorrin-2 dehydrogenase / sirohydrochlorin ferrochelatase